MKTLLSIFLVCSLVCSSWADTFFGIQNQTAYPIFVGNSYTMGPAIFSDGGYSPGWNTTPGIWVQPGAYLVSLDSLYNNIYGTISYSVTIYGNFTVNGGQSLVIPMMVAPTNITLCLTNNYSSSAMATWRLNGVVQHTESLDPGQSDCWTSHYFDAMGSNVFNTTLNAYTSSPYNDGVSNSLYNISGSGTDTTYSNIGGTFGASTNYTFGTGGNAYAQSNNILWAPSSGAASESTLQGGFGVMHSDHVQTMQGLSVINDSVKQLHTDLSQTIHNDLTSIRSALGGSTNSLGGGSTNTDYTPYFQSITNLLGRTGVFTNDNGQVVSYLAVFSNELWQITSAVTNTPNNTPSNMVSGLNSLTNLNNLTNMTASLTNLIPTNYSSESTLRGVTNLLSKLVDLASSNVAPSSLSLSNYATESTQQGISNGVAGAASSLVGISNLLARFGTSGTNGMDSNAVVGLVNKQFGLGSAAAQAGQNQLQALADAVAPGDATERYGTPLDNWQVSVPFGQGYTIQLNPFSQSWVVDLAAFVRSLVMWICAAGLYYANITCLLDAIQKLFMFRQTQTAGEEFMGTNVNTLSCLIVAGTITTLTLAIPAYATSWFGAANITSVVMSSPFHGFAANAVGCALWMVDQFFPLAFMVYCVLAQIAFRAGLMPIMWFVGTVIRFLVGA